MASWLACSPGGAPEPVAETATRIDTEALEQDFQAELDRLWEAARASDENFPGGTAAYVLADGRVFGFATGFADVEAEAPMPVDARMPSGSIGKTYVAAVALALAQQGRLDLDAPLAEWLGDEDWFPRLANHDDLTLRILLSHSGGLVDHAFESEEFAAWAKEMSAAENRDLYLQPAELVAFILDREPLFEAGQGYNYTDTGYILVGMAIERATGESYYDLLRELFLEPLHLDLTLPADRRDLPGLVQGYAHQSSQLFGTPLRIVEDGRLVIHPLNEWTGGGLVNNPQALVRWGKALYEGEAIEGDYLEQLLTPGYVADPEQPDAGYGLGVSMRRSESYGPVYGHGGFFPGYNSYLAYYPDYGVAVAMQINSDKSAVSDHVATLASVVLDRVGRRTQEDAP